MNALARIAVVGSLAVVSSMTACKSETEGQRCEIPSDCETNLVCTNLNGTLHDYKVCCPSGQSSVPACNPGIAHPLPEAGADAGADVNGDTATESSPEEPA